jgi:hypothetical protein
VNASTISGAADPQAKEEGVDRTKARGICDGYIGEEEQNGRPIARQSSDAECPEGVRPILGTTASSAATDDPQV